MTDQPPLDPADHAENFSRRYAQELDIAAGEVLMDIGIDPKQLGATDPEDLQYKTFHPDDAPLIRSYVRRPHCLAARGRPRGARRPLEWAPEVTRKTHESPSRRLGRPLLRVLRVIETYIPGLKAAVPIGPRSRSDLAGRS